MELTSEKLELLEEVADFIERMRDQNIQLTAALKLILDELSREDSNILKAGVAAGVALILTKGKYDDDTKVKQGLQNLFKKYQV